MMAQVQLQVPDSGLGLAGLQIAAPEASRGIYLSHSWTNRRFTVVLPAIPSPRSNINPILARFHAGYFRITLSLAAQSLLLKTLVGDGPATTTANPGTTSTGTDDPLHRILVMVHPTAFLLVLWSLALVTQIALSLVYFLRCVLRFDLVKAEFLNHVGVNYLFAPWISWLLLIQSAPFVKPGAVLYHILWWVCVVPVVALDVKIYGQWFTKGKRFLSMVANPTSQLTVIGNLVAAQAAAQLAWKESAVCLFSLGMVHYLVLFVTLRQRLPAGNFIPPMLRPTYFLFFAAPSAASLAWESIAGGFDMGSKMFFFLSLFLFTSLVCRPTLFKRSMRRFNVAWWAYSFPLTFLALASVKYAREVDGCVPRSLMLILSALSVLVSLILTILSLLNTRMLLPDDDPIPTVLEDRLPSAM